MPIYRQLMELLVARILDQVYLEGEMLPSVRQLAQDCDVNPLTVAKTYKELASEGFTGPRGTSRSSPAAFRRNGSPRQIPELATRGLERVKCFLETLGYRMSFSGHWSPRVTAWR